MVFGHPETFVPQPVCDLSQVDDLVEGLLYGLPHGGVGVIEHRQSERRCAGLLRRIQLQILTVKLCLLRETKLSIPLTVNGNC